LVVLPLELKTGQIKNKHKPELLTNWKKKLALSEMGRNI